MNTLSRRLKHITPVALVALLILWTAPLMAQGPIVLMGIDAEDGGPGGHGPITVYEAVVNSILSNVSNGGSGILVIGGGKSGGDNVTVFWNTIGAGIGVPITYANNAAISSVSFSGFAMIAVVSDVGNTPGGGLTAAENTLLAGRQGDIANFVNSGGGLFGLTSDFGANAYAYLGGIGSVTTIQGLSYNDITATPAGTTVGITDALDVSFWHDVYTAFPSFLSILAIDSTAGAGFNLPAAIGGAQVLIPTNLTLDPRNATNLVGQSHTVTACVTDTNGVPVVNQPIDIIATGANTASITCSTDTNGCCSLTYTGLNLGTDIITASALVNGHSNTVTATKIWVAPPQITCDVQFLGTNGVPITGDPCGEAGVGVPVGSSVLVSVQVCADTNNAQTVSNIVGQVTIDGVPTGSFFSGVSLSPGTCIPPFTFGFVCDTPGVHTFAITAQASDVGEDVSTSCSNTFECCPTCPTCELDTNGAPVVVVVDQNVTVNFNTKPPTYTGDTALLPYFTFDTNGPTADTWRAIFNVNGKALLITSNATITTTPVPNFSNNRRAPGIEIDSTCSLTVDQGSKILVQSENRNAGDILIQVDGNVTINGTVSNVVNGTRGRPGNITIGTSCGNIVTGPQGRIVTYGQDFGGSDINLASCDTGNIVIAGLVDASYKAAVASKINIASFGGDVTIIGTNRFGTEVVAGTLRTVTSGVSVRSRRDPLPGTIQIQAVHDIVVQGSTLLSKNYPNYGAVAVKTMSTGSKGGLIDARAGGNITLIDRALDNANRYNAAAVNRALAGGGIQLTVSASVDNGASNISKPVVNVQGGSGGQGGTNELRGEGTGVNVGLGAKVLADSTGPNGSVGANIISGCTGVTEAGVVSPADGAGDNTGVCGTPDPLFLDCSELGF